MENIANLQTEIEQINVRLSEMKTQRGEIAAEAKTAEQKFIAGTISLDDFQAEEFKLNLLDRTLETLENKRAQTEFELNAAIASENRRQALETAKELAFEVKTTQQEYIAVRDALNSQIETFCENLTKLHINWTEKQTAFFQTIRALNPNIRSFKPQNNVQADALWEIFGELAQIGVTDEVRKTATAELLYTPDIEFEHPIRVIEEIGLFNEKNERKNLYPYKPKLYAAAGSAPIETENVERVQKLDSSEPREVKEYRPDSFVY